MYYKVLAKCGHVGRNNYILKTFYVQAINGKIAAAIVRQTPRVKHDQKDAIRNVIEINEAEYVLGNEINSDDLYFQMTSISEQRTNQAVNYEDVIRNEDNVIVKDRNLDYKLKKNKILDQYTKNQIKGMYCVAI